MTGVEQFALFGESSPASVAQRERRAAREAERVGRIERMREDLRTDWREPGRVLALTLPWEPADGQRTREAVRCGRCGEPVLPYDLVINHDLGWCGCPTGSPGRPQLTEEQMCDRADRELAPDCAACGHPWGLHNHVIVEGGSLPAEKGCTCCYRCDGYVPPPMATSPWGTCPACWGDPHDGPCPGVKRRRR